MFENLEQYSFRKLISSVIFDFENNDYRDLPHMFNLRIVGSLKNFVEVYTNQNQLSDEVKENILNYLSQARNHNDEFSSERIDLINEMIIFINRQTEDESHIFYRLELHKRRGEFRYLIRASRDEILSEVENVHDSICNDLEVLYSHNKDIKENEFIEEYLPIFIENSDLYKESLNAFLYENPIIFKDKTFYNRMMLVLDNIKKYNKEDIVQTKEYNVLVKKINKQIKKIR